MEFLPASNQATLSSRPAARHDGADLAQIIAMNVVEQECPGFLGLDIPEMRFDPTQ
jgi:hypothetical protein